MTSPVAVVVIESVPLWLLGCFGSRVVDTPEWDRLASMSMVADRCSLSNADTIDQIISKSSISESSIKIVDDAATWEAMASGGAGDLPVLKVATPVTEENTNEAHIIWENFGQQASESVDETAVVSLASVLATEAWLASFFATLQRVSQSSAVVLLGLPPDLDRDDFSELWYSCIGDRAAQCVAMVTGNNNENGRSQRIISADVLCQSVIAAASEDRPWNMFELGMERIERTVGAVSSIRTREFLFAVDRADETIDDELPPHVLFHKPEDRFETLDVSGQYPELIEEFLAE